MRPFHSEIARAGLTALARQGAAAIALLVLSACGGDSPDPFEPITHLATLPALLEVVSGDAQRGLTGRALADSIVVRARTPSGAPAAGIELSWAATAGTLSTTTTTTDADGIARVQWIAGSGAGTATVTYPAPAPATGRGARYRLTITSEGRASGACRLDPRPLERSALTLGPTDLTRSLAATAPHHAVALFMDFSNAPATETTDFMFNRLVRSGLNRLNELSHGRIQLQVTPAPRWYRSSKPIAVGRAPFDYVLEAMRLADPDVDFSQYDLVYVVIPPSPEKPFSHTLPEGENSLLVFDGVKFSNAVSFGQDAYTYGAPVFVHETGHVFGLVDLYRYDAAFAGAPGSPIRHVGSWSIMSSAYFPAHFLAWEKRKLGILDASQVDCLEPEGPGGVEVVLQPIEVPGGLKAIALKLDASRALVIEVRRVAQVTGRDLCARGVLIYEVDASVHGGEGPVNVLGSRETTSEPILTRCGPWAEATFGVGPGEISSFVDPRSGISVQVLAAEAGGAYRVRVKR